MRQGIDYPGVTIVYFCHDGNGNFVLSKRSKNARDEHGRWDIGGGGLDFGVTVEETLYKEIKEEYCTDVLDYEFLGFEDLHRKHNGVATHWVCLYFKVLVDPTKVANGEPHKFDEVRFFRLDALPTPLHSALPRFIKEYKHKLER